MKKAKAIKINSLVKIINGNPYYYGAKCIVLGRTGNSLELHSFIGLKSCFCAKRSNVKPLSKKEINEVKVHLRMLENSVSEIKKSIEISS